MFQRGILAPVPLHARYSFFRQLPGADPRGGLRRLAELASDDLVVGIGASTVSMLGASIEGLHELPALAGPGASVPSTPAALFCWLRGDERGELVHRERAIASKLRDAFEPSGSIDAFRHRGGLDLTGYEDGTENPKGEDAVTTAIALDGSSFVAVQAWLHDFDRFDALARTEQDLAIGRRRDDNEEIDDAPPSAHVKRTAQESFDPPAFVVRRSMPFSSERGAGLVFVAFGRSLDAFEAQLGRMCGLEDGVTDALFRFTRPISSASFWCPPVRDGRLDFAALGL